jgi:hypothetical protein
MTEPVQPTQPSFQRVPPEPSAPLQTSTLTPAQGPVVPVKPPRSGQTLWINVALGLALAVALGGVAFAAGRMTAPAAAAALNGTGNGRFGNGGYFPGGGNGGAFPGGGQGTRGFGAGGLSVGGTVTAMTADSITITTATGQSVTIATNGTTTYHQQSTAAASDVKTGGKVIVQLGARTPQASPSTTGPTANDITVVP